MEKLRERILQEGRLCAVVKMIEVEIARDYCQSLRNEISRLDHSYYKDYYNMQHHSPSCRLCSLVKEVNINYNFGLRIPLSKFNEIKTASRYM